MADLASSPGISPDGKFVQLFLWPLCATYSEHPWWAIWHWNPPWWPIFAPLDELFEQLVCGAPLLVDISCLAIYQLGMGARPGLHSSDLYSEKGPTKFPKDFNSVVF